MLKANAKSRRQGQRSRIDLNVKRNTVLLEERALVDRVFIAKVNKPVKMNA